MIAPGAASLGRLLDRFGRVPCTFTRPATGFDPSTLGGTGGHVLGTAVVAVPFRERSDRTRTDEDVGSGDLISYLEHASTIEFDLPHTGDEATLEGETYRIAEGSGLDRSADALRLVLREIG